MPQSDRGNISWNYNLFARSYRSEAQHVELFLFCYCYLVALCCPVCLAKTFPPMISFLFSFRLLAFHFAAELFVTPTLIRNILICTICKRRRDSRPIMLGCDVRTLKPIHICTYSTHTDTRYTHSMLRRHLNASQSWWTMVMNRYMTMPRRYEFILNYKINGRAVGISELQSKHSKHISWLLSYRILLFDS